VLRTDEEGDEPRFRMLETVREYATERLAAAGEIDAVYARLADRYLALVAAAERTIQGTEQARWFRFFAAEQDNLKVVIAWALGCSRAETALRLINGPLWYFWSMRGWARNERPWLERALALASSNPAFVDPHVRARAYLSDGLFFLQTGDVARGRDRFVSSVTLYRTLGDAGRGGAAMALSNLATLDNDQGNYSGAQERLDEALAIRRALGATLPVALTLVNLGNVANLQGKHDMARNYLDEALVILRESGDRRAIGFCLNNLGEAAAGLGHDASAQAYFEQSLALLREIGDPNGEGFALVNIAAMALRLGDPPRAAAAVVAALAVQREVRNPVVLADAFDTAAECAVLTGHPIAAARFLAFAAATRESSQTVLTPSSRRGVERVTRTARIALGRAAFDAATITARAVDIDEAVAATVAFLQDAEGRSDTSVRPADDPDSAPLDLDVALTTRQREVLRLLVDGLTDPEIAAALGISARTVESHVAEILNKLGLHSRTAAVAHAVRHRLV
jgi:DNA-binding CsgD family transcriptional regulator/tetratricopeptide (TPR) repeat protein